MDDLTPANARVLWSSKTLEVWGGRLAVATGWLRCGYAVGTCSWRLGCCGSARHSPQQSARKRSMREWPPSPNPRHCVCCSLSAARKSAGMALGSARSRCRPTGCRCVLAVGVRASVCEGEAAVSCMRYYCSFQALPPGCLVTSHAAGHAPCLCCRSGVRVLRCRSCTCLTRTHSSPPTLGCWRWAALLASWALLLGGRSGSLLWKLLRVTLAPRLPLSQVAASRSVLPSPIFSGLPPTTSPTAGQGAAAAGHPR